MGPLVSFAKGLRKNYGQVLAAISVWVIVAEIGVMCVWSSPYLAQLTSPNSPLPLTLTEASWVASLLYLGRFIGSLTGVLVVSIFGSKQATFISPLPIALGWIFMSIADSALWLYIARVSLGIGFGFTYSCFALYLGEVANPDIRGSLVSFSIMGAPVGNLLGNLTGSNMSLLASSITYFVPCILIMIILYALPDSPYHLIKIGDFKGAKKSLKYYHGTDDVEEQFEEVTKFVKATGSASFKERLAEFRLPHVQRATILVMMLFVFMQFSGLNNILFYMEIILTRSKLTMIKPSTMVSYVLTCAVVISIAAIRIYDTCGRRILMILSSLGVTLALVVLGTHFVLMDAGIAWFGAELLPVGSLFFFVTTFCIGLGSIPSIVSSEVYAASIKPVAACFANIIAAAVAFLSSKSYQPLVDLFGEAYVFYAHAFITFMAVPYTIIWMPETRGKTLNRIQEELINKK